MPPSRLSRPLPAGTTNGRISLSILGDTIFESEESFQLRLSNSQGVLLARNAATITIVDNDPTPILAPLRCRAGP